MRIISRLIQSIRGHQFFSAVRTMVPILVVLLALQLQLLAAGIETISIKTSSVNNDVVLVNGELNGKPVQLECFLSVANCKIPNEGLYLLVRLPEDKGMYMDCPNVHLYKKSASSRRGLKIGEYCLLSE